MLDVKFALSGSVCQFGVRHKFVCSGESTAAAGEEARRSRPQLLSA